MKLRYLTIFAVCLFAIQVSAAEQPELISQTDKLSYTFGQNIGNNMKQQGIDINPDILAKGLRDALFGKTPLLNQSEMDEVLKAFKKQRLAKRAAARKQLAKKNRKEGKKFLAENAKKPGVISLPSGLQYKVITPGRGKKPQLTDEVTTHYRGTLIDGTEFDSSYKRGEPTTFKVNEVIAGWTEALQLMKEGAEWQLFIPGKLAYGRKGSGRQIGPHATLLFTIELISVGKK